MYCPQCGTLRVAAAKFCTGCGTQFDEVMNVRPEPEQETAEVIQEVETLENSDASSSESESLSAEDDVADEETMEDVESDDQEVPAQAEAGLEVRSSEKAPPQGAPPSDIPIHGPQSGNSISEITSGFSQTSYIAIGVVLILVVAAGAFMLMKEESPNHLPQGAYWTGYGESFGWYLEANGDLHYITADGVNQTNTECEDSWVHSHFSLLRQEGPICHWGTSSNTIVAEGHWQRNESHPIDGAYEACLDEGAYPADCRTFFVGSGYIVFTNWAGYSGPDPNRVVCEVWVKGDPPVDTDRYGEGELFSEWREEFFDDKFEQVSSDPSAFGCTTFDWDW